MPSSKATEAQILEITQELLQRRGYDGFSYRDVADRVGIRSATIHYYFPAKADLVVAVAERYRSDFATTLAEILADDSLSALEKVAQFADIFRQTAATNRVCLCGMLASGSKSQSDKANQHAQEFFGDLQAWLEDVFAAGRQDGSIRALAEPRRAALSVVAALEGATLMAYNARDLSQLDEVIAEALDGLRP